MQSMQLQDKAHSGDVRYFAAIVKFTVAIFYIYPFFVLFCFVFFVVVVVVRSLKQFEVNRPTKRNLVCFFLSLFALLLSETLVSFEKNYLISLTLTLVNSNLNPIIYR